MIPSIFQSIRARNFSGVFPATGMRCQFFFASRAYFEMPSDRFRSVPDSFSSKRMMRLS